MELVITDTNIFIDLHSIGMLDPFFSLPLVVHTVDFVLNELKETKQYEDVNYYVNTGKLKVYSFGPEDLMQVYSLKLEAGGNLSMADCSVWHLAKIKKCVLLTGDGQLRAKAIRSDVAVKGIIFVFDMLLKCELINKQEAISKINELQNNNARLPKQIIKDRINEWSL